jgi:hypothetical protein
MRLGRVIGALCIAAAAATSDAHASFAPLPPESGPDYVTSVDGDIAAGPRLVDDGVFYGELGRKSLVLRLAYAFEADRRLLVLPRRFDSADDWGEYSTTRSGLAASKERLAFVEAHSAGNGRYQQAQSSTTLCGGTPSGPFRTLTRCDTSAWPVPISAALDVDGARVASVDCSGRIVIHDYATGAEHIVVPQGLGGVPALRLAGDYVAYSDYSPKIRVHNWVLGADAYETPGYEGFDVAPDGTLAVATAGPEPGCTRGGLAWYSPSQPVEHVLPQKACRADVRIAGDRIAAVVPDPTRGPRIATIGLDGSQTDIANVGEVPIMRGGIDYDGERIAYALGDCAGGAELFTESATEPVLREETRWCDAKVLDERPKLGPTEKTVLLDLNCPRGCKGTATLRATIGGKSRTIGSHAVALDPLGCGLGSFPVRLSDAARERVRRRGSLAALARVTVLQRAGSPVTFKRNLRIRAAKHDRTVAPAECAN